MLYLVKHWQCNQRKVEQRRSIRFKIQLKNELKVEIQITCTDNKDKFKLQIKRPSDVWDRIDCKYVIDTSHCIFNEYLCLINKLHCCVRHIIKNVAVDINSMFSMYIIAIYNHNDDHSMDAFCNILRNYCMHDLAAEFALKHDKYRPHKVNLNCKDSITLICNFFF